MKTLEELLQNPDITQEYYNSLGNAYRRASQWDDAAIAYRKAIELDSNYALAHVNLGILLTAMQKEDDAIIHLKTALTLNPHLTPALNQLGDIYLRRDCYSDALDVFLKCLDKMPENTELNYRLGVVYFKLRDFDRAKMQFEKVLILDYKHPDINQLLANTFLEMGDHEKAMHYYFYQLERDPWFETFYNLGVLFMMKERLKDALNYFNRAIELRPDDLATLLNLGNIYLKKNQIELAMTYYEKANQLNSNDPEIEHILAALKQKTPASAPSKYITHLFDQYAPYYEKHLTEALKYEVPQKIVQTIQLEYPYFSDQRWKIIDLGCGTGLCGALLKPVASKLIGVDLSENMLIVAREKQIYDELIAKDITSALTRFSSMDLVVAADVFTYCGDLELTFKNTANALIQNGIFIFTVEKTVKDDFVLQQNIRYAHSKMYLDSLITAHDFDVICFNNIVLRQQKNEAVEGYLVFLRKKGC